MLADIHLQARDMAVGTGYRSVPARHRHRARACRSRQTLQARLLQGQDRTDDSLAVLESAARTKRSQSDDSQTARVAIQVVQAQIRSRRDGSRPGLSG